MPRFNIPPDSERCTEDIVEVYLREWRKRNHMDNRCLRIARVTVNGKRMCVRHAGAAVIALLLEGKDAKVEKL